MADETVTIVGCGYVGVRLARLCLQSGLDVHAVVRSESARRALEAKGIRASVQDLDEPFEPGLASNGLYIVYLSTTAVYGDRGGSVVTEASEPRPSSGRGRRRLDAENRVRRFGATRGTRVRILRVPGIYGPGRLPLARIAAGEPVPAPSETGPGNRIHVEDLAAVCLAALRYDGASEVFNVGDGVYASMGEYFLRVARIAGLEPPPQLSLSDLLERVSPAMRGFLTESRLVDVSRMRDELDFSPRYSDLDKGIAASLSDKDQPG